MLSGVVIEKIQDANKVSKEDESIVEDNWTEIKVEQEVHQNPLNQI